MNGVGGAENGLARLSVQQNGVTENGNDGQINGESNAMVAVGNAQSVALPAPNLEGIRTVDTHTKMVGVIQPPPDLRAIVDKTASFVAKNGELFCTFVFCSTPADCILHCKQILGSLACASCRGLFQIKIHARHKVSLQTHQCSEYYSICDFMMLFGSKDGEPIHQQPCMLDLPFILRSSASLLWH